VSIDSRGFEKVISKHQFNSVSELEREYEIEAWRQIESKSFLYLRILGRDHDYEILEMEFPRKSGQLKR
jgi:hypothetical protein